MVVVSLEKHQCDAEIQNAPCFVLSPTRMFAPKSVHRFGGSGLEYRSAVPAQFGWENSLSMCTGAGNHRHPSPRDIWLALLDYAHKLARRYGWRTDKTLPQGVSPEEVANDVIIKVIEGDRTWDEAKEPALLKTFASNGLCC